MNLLVHDLNDDVLFYGFIFRPSRLFLSWIIMERTGKFWFGTKVITGTNLMKIHDCILTNVVCNHAS